ncbi:MAG: hypothetical protein Ct9H90mP22_7850 [Gammaproteobacteria bacterium]|nr:MAG: hypothetical protein Ct9H90mP22_7850 [Gammaproteobacteria bacterium]
MIESELDKFRGSVATFLIQNGTLKVGDLVVSGNSMGKIKSIVNSDGRKLNLQDLQPQLRFRIELCTWGWRSISSCKK